ncbi:MAG: hypothetical protein ACREEG_04120, partial [Phenylobacterium sp.]
MASVAARAQPADPLGDVLARAQADNPAPTQQSASHPLRINDQILFRQAIEASRRGDLLNARSAIAAMGDSLAKKTAIWVMVDSNADS